MSMPTPVNNYSPVCEMDGGGWCEWVLTADERVFYFCTPMCMYEFLDKPEVRNEAGVVSHLIQGALYQNISAEAYEIVLSSIGAKIGEEDKDKLSILANAVMDALNENLVAELRETNAAAGVVAAP